MCGLAATPATGSHPVPGRIGIHLDTLLPTRHSQNQITCMDCHAASIAFSRTPVSDTVYYNDNLELPSNHTAGYPWQPFTRRDAFDENNILDSLPTASALRLPGAENPDWITTAAPSPGTPGHANGSVDVVFAERNANWTDDNSILHRASWNPIRLSCDAVACHGHRASETARYVWKDIAEETP